MNFLFRLLIISLMIVMIAQLQACQMNDLKDLEPSGPIARSIDDLFWITVALMATVLAPVFVMTACFTWKYRASNHNAEYSPDWDSSIELEWLVWLIPALIVAILSILTWIYSHRLDPYKAQTSALPPLEIQVVAMDWKWLFIYPEQNIATVNEMAIPIHRAIALKITSNTVMNSFFIPRLGGQIYAMAGMETQMHLIADLPGRYFGENIQFSGRGFSYQNFNALVGSQQYFENWIKKVKTAEHQLDDHQFGALAKPSIHHPVTYYASVQPGLFKQVINRFQGSQNYQGKEGHRLSSQVNQNSLDRNAADVR